MAFSVNFKFLIFLSFEKKKLAAQFYFPFQTDSFRVFRAAFAFFFAIIRLKNIQTIS